MNELNNMENNDSLMDIPVVPDSQKVSNELPVTQNIETLNDVASAPTTEVLSEQISQPVANSEPSFETPVDYSGAQTIGGLNSSVVPDVQITQLNQTPTYDDTSDVIPETIESNYGVIPPNNSDTVLKEAKSAKNPNKIGIAIIGVVAIILLALGFLVYKFYFAVNPVKTVTNKIREFGKNLDDSTKNLAEIKMFQANDKLSYTSELDLGAELLGEKYMLDMATDVRILKNDNKVYANVNSNINDENLMNYSATIYKNALFIKVLEEGHNFRFTPSDLQLNSFNELLSALYEEVDKTAKDNTFERLSDYLADAIEKNINKKDFEVKFDKANINGKESFATKYSFKLDSKTTSKVFIDIVNKLKEDLQFKEALKEVDTSAIDLDFGEFNLNAYVSLSGLIKVEFLPIDEGKEVGEISLSKISKEEKVFLIHDNESKEDLLKANIKDEKDKTIINMDLYDMDQVANINMELLANGSFNMKIDVEEMSIKVDSKINRKEETKKITQDGTLVINIEEKTADPTTMKFDITFKSTLKADDNITVPMPSGAITFNTEIGQSMMSDEISQSGLLKLIESAFNNYVYPQIQENIINNTNENIYNNDNYENDWDYTYNY